MELFFKNGLKNGIITSLIFLFCFLFCFKVWGETIAPHQYLPFIQSTTTDTGELKANPDYYTITSVEVEKLEDNFLEDSYKLSFDLGSVIEVVDGLIALGKKIWPIIEAGKPVIHTNLNPPISVLPKTTMTPDEAFYEMSNWETPKSAKYKVSFKNGFNSEVVSFVYTVIFQYNGQFEGRGKYLTGVSIIAGQVKVAWGFEFDAMSSLASISNTGTKENPIAGATIKLDYKAKSVLSEIDSSEVFFVDGLGVIKKL